MRSSILAIAAAALALAACASEPEGTPGVGAVEGSRLAAGSGEGPAAPIGPLAGGLIGAEIGRSLDEADRRAALEAEYQALEYGRAGQKVEWRSAASGNYGEIVVGPSYEVNLLDCREFTHTVFIGGRARVARGTACRRPDASWRMIG